MSMLDNDHKGIWIAFVVLALAPIPVLGSSYYEGILARILLISVLAVALNIVFGQTDQLFLFSGGLAGFGAYGTALLADWLSLSAWITLPLAAILAGGIGLLVSWISAKRNFTVVLIAILTLSLQFVLTEIYVGARDITGGSTGFSYDVLSLESITAVTGLGNKVVVYYLVLILLLVSLLLYVRLINSKYGVAFAALREDELAAESIGIDVDRYKMVAGFLSAFLIGFTGPLIVKEAGYILPSAFSFFAIDVVILIVLIVGGLRTTLGPVFGAVIVVAIEQVLASYASNWRTALFGALLILLFIYFQNGVVVWFRQGLADLDIIDR
ncbi:branched-chain amino acid ABC transporter permease [Halobellus clavatus]|uniref:Branched-chain amino acid transport system permease protein n=1 Tax=Halobellus clavatus TaxID=660517 RepID=A0A1H3IUC7_9EURY|nr:branched-chain amino acid ABC transporter permease [Halobellus clavatus]SDY31311.1 branched-chain amino acid transport system permease protein [Halobellus clavatus]